jgi:1-deoxy-D-xylulose-5-phosphate reductoisomerase
VIEAHLLFGLDFDQIEVVVHPQSIVHSMVEFHDGATIAQASPPDMRLPIALALAWPDRVPDAASGIDWTHAQSWDFEPVDHEAFPGLGLAIAAGRRAGLAPAIYNAANEVCVTAFLDGRLPYLGIVDTVAAVMTADDVPSYEGRLGIDATVEESLDAVLAADAWARGRASELIGARSH